MLPNQPRRTARTRISAASLAGRGQTPLGVAGSLVLHGLIIAATLFTFSHRLDIIDQSAPVVPVDLVTLSNKTNVMATVRQAPKIQPEIKPAPPTPPTPVEAPAPPQDNSEAPPPPPDQAASEPVIEKPPPLPTPRAKPQDTPKEDKKKFDVDNVLALLSKVAPAPSRTNARVASRTVQGIGDQTAMTADLQAMLLGMIKPCWSPPVGAPHPEDLIVDFDVVLNPDGSVARPPQLLAQSSASAGDPYFRAAAEAARRAIYTCAPYKLPADRYGQWREISDFRFDPRQMMGD
jgi:outer membrane biosynthesis protein TonB